jgi:hypothetical protein
MAARIGSTGRTGLSWDPVFLNLIDLLDNALGEFAQISVIAAKRENVSK